VSDIEAMARRRGKGNTPVVTLRLPLELADRIERHRERMSKAHPGVEFSTTAAMVELLTRGLESVEAHDKRRKG
jgi:hypothetical protein